MCLCVKPSKAKCFFILFSVIVVVNSCWHKIQSFEYCGQLYFLLFFLCSLLIWALRSDCNDKARVSINLKNEKGIVGLLIPISLFLLCSLVFLSENLSLILVSFISVFFHSIRASVLRDLYFRCLFSDWSKVSIATTSFLASTEPTFTSSNYRVWVVKMRSYLKAFDLWEVVEISEVPM